MAAISRYALAALANALWQVAVVYVAALVCAWLLRGSHRRQHNVWLAAFALSVLLPVAALVPGGKAHDPGAPPDSVAGLRPVRRDAPLSPETTLGRLVLATYLMLVFWAGGRRLFSERKMRRIVSLTSQRVLPSALEGVLARCQAKFSVPDVRILTTTAWPAPLTTGFQHPLIILPESILDNGSEDVLLTILGHELAHIQRRDFLWNALVEAFYPFIAFHPCAALIRRRIRDTRELACDDLVTEKVLEAPRYAAALLEVALQSAEAPIAVAEVATLGAGNLEERIRRLIVRSCGKAKQPFLAVAAATGVLLSVSAAALAYSFQPSDPSDFTGIWQENWGLANLRRGIQFDPNQCCYRILEIRYQNGQTRLTEPIQNPLLENGVLQFRDRERAFELMPAGDGRALVRSNAIPHFNERWVAYTKLR